MYCLYNDFSDHEISRHRSLLAVYRAKAKLDRSLQNGSYLPTSPRKIIKGELERLDNDDQQLWFAIDQEFCYSPLSQIR